MVDEPRKSRGSDNGSGEVGGTIHDAPDPVRGSVKGRDENLKAGGSSNPNAYGYDPARGHLMGADKIPQVDMIGDEEYEPGTIYDLYTVISSNTVVNYKIGEVARILKHARRENKTGAQGLHWQPKNEADRHSLIAYIYEVLREAFETLVNRGQNYADFRDNSKVMVRGLSSVMEFPEGTPEFISAALIYIHGKLARLQTGDMLHRDSWLDIAGYAMITVAGIDRMEVERVQNIAKASSTEERCIDCNRPVKEGPCGRKFCILAEM